MMFQNNGAWFADDGRRGVLATVGVRYAYFIGCWSEAVGPAIGFAVFPVIGVRRSAAGRFHRSPPVLATVTGYILGVSNGKYEGGRLIDRKERRKELAPVGVGDGCLIVAGIQGSNTRAASAVRPESIASLILRVQPSS